MIKTACIFLIAILFIFISCSKDDSTSPQDNTDPAALYYPGNAGSTFTYSVSIDNSAMGQRVVTFSESSENGGIYLKQTSMIDTATSVSYFRKTDGGVYFYVDTTGLAGFIPDSLKSLLTLTIDQEVTAFVKTFSSTIDWTAFKMDVNIFNIPYNVILVSAHYAGSEDITLNLTTGSTTKSAQKIKYDMKYTVPNLMGGQPQVQTYTAYMWFVKDVGLAKLEGNATVINALGGGGVDFADTSRVMTQSLVSYTIK